MRASWRMLAAAIGLAGSATGAFAQKAIAPVAIVNGEAIRAAS